MSKGPFLNQITPDEEVQERQPYAHVNEEGSGGDIDKPGASIQEIRGAKVCRHTKHRSRHGLTLWCGDDIVGW